MSRTSEMFSAPALSSNSTEKAEEIQIFDLLLFDVDGAETRGEKKLSSLERGSKSQQAMHQAILTLRVDNKGT